MIVYIYILTFYTYEVSKTPKLGKIFVTKIIFTRILLAQQDLSM